MIDFIFWNLVIFVSLLIVVKADKKTDFVIMAVTYIVTLWFMVTFVITSPFILYGTQTNATNGEIDATATPLIIYPDEVAVNVGVINSGNVSSIQAEDGQVLDVQEIAGTPGLVINFTFLKCDFIPYKYAIKYTYNGGAGHDIQHKLNNVESGTYTTFIDSAVYTLQNLSITFLNGADYTGDSCLYEASLYHPQNGLVTHNIEIDFIALQGMTKTGGRETYNPPQNFLDIIYNIYLFMFTYYTGRKILFTELSQKATKALKEWWKK